jgi:hypothetical protein
LPVTANCVLDAVPGGVVADSGAACVIGPRAAVNVKDASTGFEPRPDPQSPTAFVSLLGYVVKFASHKYPV